MDTCIDAPRKKLLCGFTQIMFIFFKQIFKLLRLIIFSYSYIDKSSIFFAHSNIYISDISYQQLHINITKQHISDKYYLRDRTGIRAAQS